MGGKSDLKVKKTSKEMTCIRRAGILGDSNIQTLREIACIEGAVK